MPGRHGVRTRKERVDDFTRQRIQTTQIVKRLTEHALSDVEIMTTSQVTAAATLLRKSLPDLSSEDLNISGGITVEINDHWAKISKS